MNLLEVSAVVSVENAMFKIMRQLSNEDIDNKSWLDKINVEMNIEVREIEVVEETEEYYIIAGGENVYKQYYEDYTFNLYSLHYPTYNVRECIAFVYVKEGEEVKGKNLLVDKFKDEIDKMIKMCNLMKEAIDKKEKEWK